LPAPIARAPEKTAIASAPDRSPRCGRQCRPAVLPLSSDQARPGVSHSRPDCRGKRSSGQRSRRCGRRPRRSSCRERRNRRGPSAARPASGPLHGPWLPLPAHARRRSSEPDRRCRRTELDRGGSARTARSRPAVRDARSPAPKCPAGLECRNTQSRDPDGPSARPTDRSPTYSFPAPASPLLILYPNRIALVVSPEAENRMRDWPPVNSASRPERGSR
jgi:hypothetical protein